MSRGITVAVVVRSGLLVLCLLVACGGGSEGPPPDARITSGALELVGHSDLQARGMNSALAIAGDYAYVGSRTDGVSHENAGVLIVDISDPASPSVVGSIGRPEQDLLGMTSRELRAVPDKNLLIVMNFACSIIHNCRTSTSMYPDTGGVEEVENIKLYDISDPTMPMLINTYEFGTHPGNELPSPHEFFLWRDPNDSDRLLLYVATPLGPPALQILDISDPQHITVLTTFDPEQDAGLEEMRGPDALLHSVGTNAAGTVAYISYEAAGLLLADTSQVAANMPSPTITLLHAADKRVDWSPPRPEGAHSAVEVPGRDLAIVTDEIYPSPRFAGCPWGWMRVVDYSDPANPRVAGEFKTPFNEDAFCTGDTDRLTYTAHNTTATESMALITWHSAGFFVVDTTNPEKPTQLAEFVPTPLASVATEDPLLVHEVLMWSYPVIKDGLIYVVDIRNGLYILRYTGDYADEISGRAFLEGNSNLR